MSLKSLQNGSDIRGVSIDSNPEEKVNFTKNTSEILGKAFCSWLRTSFPGIQEPVIGIGTDSRLSGPDIKRGFIDGLVSQGVKVIDCGMATTPAMFMATQLKEFKCDGAVMVTASHLPPNRNGLKFFTRKGGLEKADISKIIEIAEDENFKTDSISEIKNSNIIIPYSRHLIDYIREKTNQDQPLNGLKIIVDAGNGAGGFFAKSILQPLGADTKGSQFLNPDGNFPNHTPNPEDKDAMKAICDAVIKHNADLGVIFDTDVDRAAVVDKKGNPINRNKLIALLSAIVLNEHPKSTIVTDSVTSTGLAEFIEKKGGKHHRYRRGYKNVINESIRLNSAGEESCLAIETSGHGAFKENYFLDDGAFIVAKILIEVANLAKRGKDIASHLAGLKEPLDAKEFRIKILTESFLERGNKVIEELKEFVKNQEGWIPEKVNHEGYRVNCTHSDEKGWFLLRMSLHDPVLPMNIETNVHGGIEKITNRLLPFFEQFSDLNSKSLTDH